MIFLGVIGHFSSFLLSGHPSLHQDQLVVPLAVSACASQLRQYRLCLWMVMLQAFNGAEHRPPTIVHFFVSGSEIPLAWFLRSRSACKSRGVFGPS